ncbi:MAG: RNA-binding protein [Pseudomonadota bacterium]
MARGGAAKAREEPERRCLVSGQSGSKASLIRFVTGPDGQVVPDVLGKLPGRGYYVSADRASLDHAVAKRLFSKGAKAQVSVPEGLVDEVERQVAQRVVSLLAMARKAGLALAGFEKVRGALATQNVKALFQASDGSERGKGKLWTPEGARWFGILTADELGMAFGRTRVIHGAVLSGGLTTRVVEEAAKLKGLRDTGNGASGAGKE